MNPLADNKLRIEFEQDAVGQLMEFLLILEDIWLQEPAVQQILEEKPETLVRDRTLKEIALDDLMDSFAFIMQGVEDETRIPGHYFLSLMRARHGSDITKGDALNNLNVRIEQKRNAKEPHNTMPAFVDMLLEKADQPLIAELSNRWITLNANIAAHALDDEALSTSRQARTLTQLFSQAVNQAMTQRVQNEQMRAMQAQQQARPANDNPQKGTPIPVKDTNQGTSAQQRARDKMQKDQEIYQLRTQMEAIKERLKELGDAGGSSKMNKLKESLETKDLPEEVRAKVNDELDKIEEMPPQSPEYHKTLDYLGYVDKLPWNEFSELQSDLNVTEEILEADHYGLEKVKEAIVEHVAVENRTGQNAGTILCLIGPPGVGKTSLGKSIANATGREFVRASLGGIRDESDIRGHRRTYIGSKPGRIIDSLIKAKTNNPMIQLDEIDKMNDGGFSGDPTSAMLEVLDPEQNSTFHDHYMEVDIDLSKVMFVATANYEAKIPHALRDRMKIIRIAGYTREEKMEIAKRYLVKKQMAATGLTDSDLQIDEDVLGKLISHYTREAGVRGIEKQIGHICRKVVTNLEKGIEQSAHVTTANLEDYIGKPKVHVEDIKRFGTEQVGVVNGLVYSAVGGATLPITVDFRHSRNPETSLKKEFELKVTGNMRDVMKESTAIALTVATNYLSKLGFDLSQTDSHQIHFNTPDSGPKDGPSAGTAITLAMISRMTNIPIKSNIAMTGTIDSRNGGHVGIIGGLKEKLDGAVRDGADTVLIPRDNVKDLDDIPESTKEKLNIIPVDTIEDVMKIALTEMPKPSAPKPAQQAAPGAPSAT